MFPRRLQQVTRAQVKKDGGIIEGRLTALMGTISDDVRLCIAGCDTYIEKNLISMSLISNPSNLQSSCPTTSPFSAVLSVGTEIDGIHQ